MLCTVQDVTDRISSYSVSSEARIIRFITTYQQTLVAESRRDWVASSSAMNTAQTELVRANIASNVAVREINANSNNFPSLNYKINILNVVQDEFIRTGKALKDLDNSDIRALP